MAVTDEGDMCMAKRNDNLSDTEIEYYLHSFTSMIHSDYCV